MAYNGPSYQSLSPANKRRAMAKYRERQKTPQEAPVTVRQPSSISGLLADIQANPLKYFPALGTGAAGQTAQAATYLNYGPQFDALAGLLGSARETRRSGVQSAQRTGLAGSQGIQHIRDTYLTGLKDTLGEAGGPVAADAPVHSADARAAQQLGLSGSALAGMLSGMAAQQVAGIGAQTGQLNRQFNQSRNEIASKIPALLGQAGAYNVQQYETLAAAGAKEKAAAARAAADRRLRMITAGINPETGQYDPSLKAPEKPRAVTVNKYGRTPEQWAALTDAQRQKIIKDYSAAGRAPTSGSGNGMTPAQRQARLEQYDGLRTTINNIGADLETLAKVKIHINPQTGAVVKPDADGVYPDGTTVRAATPAEITAKLRKDYPHATPLLLRAAREMAGTGIMPDTIKALKRRYKGFEIPHAWHFIPTNVNGPH